MLIFIKTPKKKNEQVREALVSEPVFTRLVTRIFNAVSGKVCRKNVRHILRIHIIIFIITHLWVNRNNKLKKEKMFHAIYFIRNMCYNSNCDYVFKEISYVQF